MSKFTRDMRQYGAIDNIQIYCKMSSAQRRQLLKNFLSRFDTSPIILSQNNKQIESVKQFLFFPITYFGKCFLEGYRIVEKIGDNFFLLSRMEIQNGGNLSFKTNETHSMAKHGKFIILCIQFDEKLNEDKDLRIDRFNKVKEIATFLCGVDSFSNCEGIEAHFLFVSTFLYSVADLKTIDHGSRLQTEKFYNYDYGLGKRSRGLRKLDDKEQGTKLHELIELIIKGAGKFRSKQYLQKKILNHFCYEYELQKLLNTLCFIIGRQMLEGGYLTISSQKWMRKYSSKKFRKFDLLLRNQKKACIIDWKMSRVLADQKITTTMDKNIQYIQLARKDYNSEVELKFYCIHGTKILYHHKYTCATYNYAIEQIQIQDNKQYIVNQDGQIQIDSDSQSWGMDKFIRDRNNKRHRSILDRISHSEDHADGNVMDFEPQTVRKLSVTMKNGKEGRIANKEKNMDHINSSFKERMLVLAQIKKRQEEKLNIDDGPHVHFAVPLVQNQKIIHSLHSTIVPPKKADCRKTIEIIQDGEYNDDNYLKNPEKTHTKNKEKKQKSKKKEKSKKHQKSKKEELLQNGIQISSGSEDQNLSEISEEIKAFRAKNSKSENIYNNNQLERRSRIQQKSDSSSLRSHYAKQTHFMHINSGTSPRIEAKLTKGQIKEKKRANRARIEEEDCVNLELEEGEIEDVIVID